MLMILLKETRDVIVKRAIVTALSNIVDCTYLLFLSISLFILYLYFIFYILYFIFYILYFIFIKFLIADNAVEVIDDDGLEQLLVLMEKTDDERLLSGIVHTVSNIANSGM